MIAYVPRERYNDVAKRNDEFNSTRREEWDTCGEWGAVYDLEWDTSRAATAAEYKRRKSFKVMPDEILGATGKMGPGARLPRLKIRDKFNHWTVMEILKRPLRYLCECDCEARTRTILRPSTLLNNLSLGCVKCSQRRKERRGYQKCAYTRKVNGLAR